MKPSHHSTLAQEAPPQPPVASWLLTLQHLHQRVAPHFARPEPHRHALLYLQAVLSDIPRKNGWQIAEHARQAHPYGMQRLLSQAVWDHDGVRDELCRLVVTSLQPPSEPSAPAESASPFPVLVIDESGFPKRGRHSAGVGPQYCGVTGRVDNCQVGVFLSYVTARGHALIDRELYLPEDWCRDLARRQAVHLPQTLTFATKPELGRRMVQRAREAKVPIKWVVADTVYGHSADLRRWLEEHDLAYALAVPSIEVVCVPTQHGPLLADVAQIADTLTPADWQRLSAGGGTKGERLFDWALLPLMQAGGGPQRHFLLVRRCIHDATQLSYWLVFAPPLTPLSVLVQASGARWHIEEDLQTSKDLGLDQYEVRSYVGWYRHITLVLLACAFLLSLCREHSSTAEVPHEPTTQAEPPLIALTGREVQHLLAHLIFPAPTSAALICHWSCFRRGHQYWAGYYHRRRREKRGLASHRS